jgi:hypothetical protein
MAVGAAGAVIAAAGNPTALRLASTALWVAANVVAWAVPQTVVTEEGIRRPATRAPRRIAWSDVASLETRRHGSQEVVYAILGDGVPVWLRGVPADALQGLRALAEASGSPADRPGR